MYLYIFGIYYTSAVNTSLVNATQPVITALVMYAAGRERMTLIKTMSIGIGVSGCVSLILFDVISYMM